MVMEESGIREVWNVYSSALLIEEKSNVIPAECCVERPLTGIPGISEGNVERALRSMKGNQAPRPSAVSGDLLKFADRNGITHLTKLYQQVMCTETYPEEWKDSAYTLP